MTASSVHESDESRISTLGSAILACVLTLIGTDPAAAQDICRKGRDVRLLELMLENERSRAVLAYQHGNLARGDVFAAQAARIEADLPYAQLDQEIASFPLFRNPR